MDHLANKGRERMLTKFYQIIGKKVEISKVADIYGRMILKWVLRNWVGECRLFSFGSQQEEVVGSSLDFIKGKIFLEKTNNYLLLKKEFPPWN